MDGGATVRLATRDDKRAIEEVPYEERHPDCSVYTALCETARTHGTRPALSFQLKGDPDARAETFDWVRLAREVTRLANALRRLGVGADDRVAYVLPNANETVVTLLAAMTAGVVVPVNPLLETGQIAAILRDAGAKAVVTLAPFPKTDIAQKVDAALEEAPDVRHLIEIDLKRYLTPPLSWIVPLLRPKLKRRHRAEVHAFWRLIEREDGDRLDFGTDETPDRIAAVFHTGGTTGHPKLARHAQRGQVYNGRMPATVLIGADDVLICPLPMFHVLAAYPILMTCVVSGAHLVLPTPAGFRGEGVMDNFWKLVERWRVSLMVMVPTAASALMQRRIDADVSSLKYAICGSAPLPVELFRRFEKATNVRILEGYGMTEATCLVSINPPEGERKIGSVGLPIPYTDVKILQCREGGLIDRECDVDEVGEICVRSPGVFPGYSADKLNADLFAGPDRYLRTGDLGRIDADGYIWITGRAKDLIIRGGHNIDPAVIEDTLCQHEAVAFAGAIGQPDAHSGEVPAAYVELCDGASVTRDDLAEFVRERISEKAAVPKYIEVMDELPKTAVGKIFKPDLRKAATKRVYGAALAEAGIDASVEMVDDRTLGLTAEVRAPGASDEQISAVLGDYARPWRRAGSSGA